MDRYTLRSQQLPSRKLTVETAYQGIWYIVSFAIAWIPWYCFAFDQIIIHGKHEVFEYLRIFTQPLQRVFNSLMYFRPKYLSARARYKTETRLIIALEVIDYMRNSSFALCQYIGIMYYAAAFREEESL
jgi:hypothetical protein